MLRYCSLLLLGFCSIATGAEPENKFNYGWFATGMMSAIDDDDDRNIEDGLVGYHFGVGRSLGRSHAIELNVTGMSFDTADPEGGYDQVGFGLDYLYRFGSDNTLSPYAIVGGGYLKSDFNQSPEFDDDGAMGSAGLGLLIPMGGNGFFLRTELRVRKDFSGPGYVDYLLNFGVHFATPFRPARAQDDDGDSVANDNDRCPGTPPGTTTDRFGCAIKD